MVLYFRKFSLSIKTKSTTCKFTFLGTKWGPEPKVFCCQKGSVAILFFVCQSFSSYFNHKTNVCRPVTQLALSTKESCTECKWLRKKKAVLTSGDMITFNLLKWRMKQKYQFQEDLNNQPQCLSALIFSKYCFLVSRFLVTLRPVSLDTLEGKISGVRGGSQKQSSDHVWDFLCSYLFFQS